MSLDGEIKRRLDKALLMVDDLGTRGTRLLDDAERFCKRLHKLVAAGVVPRGTDSTAMELCCYALQLPLKSARATAAGKTGRTNLRERAEAAAEMLVGLFADAGHDSLLERTVEILNEVYQRHPEGEAARLVADALNLEDFGVIGLVHQVIALGRQGGGLLQVADGMEKREQYGYWEARLNEGFHFEQVRQMAKRRLEHARRVANLLANELREDGAV